MKLSNSAFNRMVKQCLAEVITEASQVEPYDPETDTFQPSPRERTSPVEIPCYLCETPVEPDFAKKWDNLNKTYNLGPQDQIPPICQKCFRDVVKLAQAQKQGVKESDPPHEKWTDTFGQKMPGEFIAEMGVKADTNRLSASERRMIGKAFAERGLDGNGRFEKKEGGLGAITDALNSLGFQLDMVSGDLILGDKGTRAFIFRRVNTPGQDPFTQKDEIPNSRIVFNWELLSPNKFEILAYAS